jgi:protein arginine kinase
MAHTVSMPSDCPLWTQPTGRASAIAPWVELTLNRNLADFPFPSSANEDEMGRIEARLLEALDKAGLMTRGRYYTMRELSAVDQHRLAERRLAVDELLLRGGPRGVFLRDDQSLCIMINGVDHLSVRIAASGHEAEPAWQELNNLDNVLSGLLDFAFDSRRGYLTSVLDNVGTGLRVRTLLHLPGLRQTDGLLRHAEAGARQGLILCGVRTVPGLPPLPEESAPPQPEWAMEYLHADVDSALFGIGTDTLGDLYLLSTHATLGRSEPELLFAMQHCAAEMAGAEESARAQMLSQGRLALEDRVGRAIGAAREARLIGFEEGYAILSSLRLGAACRVLNGTPPLAVLNELLVTIQGAHLAAELPASAGALDLPAARADRFRALFG